MVKKTDLKLTDEEQKALEEHEELQGEVKKMEDSQESERQCLDCIAHPQLIDL